MIQKRAFQAFTFRQGRVQLRKVQSAGLQPRSSGPAAAALALDLPQLDVPTWRRHGQGQWQLRPTFGHINLIVADKKDIDRPPAWPDRTVAPVRSSGCRPGVHLGPVQRASGSRAGGSCCRTRTGGSRARVGHRAARALWRRPWRTLTGPLNRRRSTAGFSLWYSRLKAMFICL